MQPIHNNQTNSVSKGKNVQEETFNGLKSTIGTLKNQLQAQTRKVKKLERENTHLKDMVVEKEKKILELDIKLQQVIDAERLQREKAKKVKAQYDKLKRQQVTNNKKSLTNNCYRGVLDYFISEFEDVFDCPILLEEMQTP